MDYSKDPPDFCRNCDGLTKLVDQLKAQCLGAQQRLDRLLEAVRANDPYEYTDVDDLIRETEEVRNLALEIAK